MFTVITLCVVDHVFEPRSGQTKDYEIGIYCFSAKGLRRNSKDCLAWIMCLRIKLNLHITMVNHVKFNCIFISGS
jgi:hypothetical protein